MTPAPFCLLAALRSKVVLLVLALFSCLSSHALTSPAKTRVEGSDQLTPGRFCSADSQAFENAIGLERHGYENASGRPQWLNQDPIQESGAELVTQPLLGRFFQGAIRRSPLEIASRAHSWLGFSLQRPFGQKIIPSTFEMANLYNYVVNDPINRPDPLGLVSLPPGWAGPRQPYREDCNPFAGPPIPCIRECGAAAAWGVAAGALVASGNPTVLTALTIYTLAVDRCLACIGNAKPALQLPFEKGRGYINHRYDL
jgi:hypothetical protein